VALLIPPEAMVIFSGAAFARAARAGFAGIRPRR
jgi:hypothetical protein